MTAQTTIIRSDVGSSRPGDPSGAGVAGGRSAVPQVRVFKRVEQVGEAWQRLEAMGVQAAGQSRAVVRQWLAATGVPVADQFFVLVEAAGDPVALLPLVRRRVAGVRLLEWVTPTDIGPCAPLADRSYLIELGHRGRRDLWERVTTALRGEADLLRLAAVPGSQESGANLFAELGLAARTGLAARAAFASWAEVASTQWTRTRRASDDGDSDILAAAGTVGFRSVAGSDKRARALVELLLKQRHDLHPDETDIWSTPGGADFLRATVTAGSGIDARIQVLSLDRNILALRHAIVVGGRMVATVSSLSAEARERSLPAAEQCLLRVMRSVFDGAVEVADFGLTPSLDERRWCNEFVPVHDRYQALTALGRATALMLLSRETARAAAANPLVRGAGRRVAALVRGMVGRAPPPAVAAPAAGTVDAAAAEDRPTAEA